MRPVWRIDLHLHTAASHDCLSSPAAVVERAARLGLARIAVTDHDEIEGALAARRLDEERVIVGEEVRTREGLDLIGLYLERRVPPGLPFLETAAEIRRQGGVTYLPHPFDPRRGTRPETLEPLARAVDVVETFNARCHQPRAHRTAAGWAEARALPAAASSDAHLLSELGNAFTEVEPFAGPAELLTVLRRGRRCGETAPRWVHLGSTGARIWKLLTRSGR